MGSPAKNRAGSRAADSEPSEVLQATSAVVPKDVEPGAPEKPGPGSVMLTTVSTMAFAGPLPHPEILARYEEVLPGAADRIISMAEKQAAHRMHLEKIVVEGDSRRAWWGQWIGGILALVAIGGGICLILQGKSGWGFAVIVAEVASLAAAFIYAHRSRRKELDAKASPSSTRPSSPRNRKKRR